MRVICSGRKTSRTTQLIEMCAEAESLGEISYIVCHNHQTAYHIAERAREMGLSIRFPLSFEEFKKGLYNEQIIKNFYIDNADYLLQNMTQVPIRAVVFEKEPDESS